LPQIGEEDGVHEAIALGVANLEEASWAQVVHKDAVGEGELPVGGLLELKLRPIGLQVVVVLGPGRGSEVRG
jgi:hypothetical protein